MIIHFLKNKLEHRRLRKLYKFKSAWAWVSVERGLHDFAWGRLYRDKEEVLDNYVGKKGYPVLVEMKWKRK